MTLQLGVHLGQQNMDMATLRSTWRRLDEAGVDWLSLWDHFYEVPPQDGTEPHFEAVAALGAMCAETHNARLGCLVFYVGYRNPALLAKTAATLDHLSGGRFELGLGAGWHVWEAEAYGYDFPDLGTRFDMLEEAMPLVRSMLSEERTTHEGPYWRAERAANNPPPVQERLPLWIGGIGERRTLRIAARWADGWNGAYVTPDEFARLNGVLDGWCEIEGTDSTAIERSVNIMFNLSLSSSRAEEEARIRAQWGPLASRVLPGALLGTPDEAVSQLLAFHAAGADGVNIVLRAPWDAAALDVYFDEVVPAVRSAAA